MTTKKKVILLVLETLFHFYSHFENATLIADVELGN